MSARDFSIAPTCAQTHEEILTDYKVMGASDTEATRGSGCARGERVTELVPVIKVGRILTSDK